MAISLSNLLNTLMGERTQRYGEGLGSLKDVINLFSPGATKGEEQQALTAAQQGLVSSGLGGTTRAGALSAGIKAQMEGIRKSRLADALSNIAGYIQTGTPTAGEISHLATGGFSGQLQEKIASAPGQPLGPLLTVSNAGGGGSSSGGGGHRYIPSWRKYGR